MNPFSPDINLISTLNQSNDLIAVSNFDSHFIELNQKWEEVTGFSIEELKSKPIFEFIHPEDRIMSKDEAQALYDGKPETIKFENRYIKKNGEIIWLEWNSVMDYNQKLSFSIAREITSYKIASLFSNQAKELMTFLVTYSNELPEKNEFINYALTELLALYNADCISFWDFNEHEQSIHCKNSKEKEGVKTRIGLNLSRESSKSYFDAILHNNIVAAPEAVTDSSTFELKSYFEEYNVTSLLDGIVNEGLNKCVLCIETSKRRNWTNQESNTLIAITNIISNFLNHQQLAYVNSGLKDALEEKNILFKELHHRIKNNLNMVANLLSLKSLLSPNPDLVEFVKETKNRIYSISKTHDQLLKLEELDQLNVREYLNDLISNVINSYTPEPELYPISDSIENHTIDVDLILSIGLLTNEIVSNIIKYAYDAKVGGEIIIVFKVVNNTYLLEIGDKGIGIQNDRRDSLGLTLIDLLVKQSNGSLERDTSSGVHYKIKIPIDGRI